MHRRIRRLWPGGLHGFLMGLVLLALIPAAVLLIWSTWSFRQEAMQLSRERSFAVARLAGAGLERSMYEADHLLSVLARLPMADHGQVGGAFSQVLAGRPEYSFLGLLDTHGRVLAASPAGRASMPEPNPELLARASTSASCVLGSPALRNSRAMVLAARYLPGPGGGRYLLLELDLTLAGELIRHAALSVGTTFSVSNAQGQILYRHPDPGVWMGRLIPAEQLATMARTMSGEGDEAVFHGLGLDGVERLYAFKRMSMGLGGEDLFLRLGIPAQAVYAGPDRLLTWSLTGLALVCLVSLGLARLVARRVVLDKVGHLLRAVGRLEAGDLSARTGLSHGQGEMGTLARAFDSMSESLLRRDEAARNARLQLEQSEIMLRTMFDATSDSVMLLDPQGRILAMNIVAAERRQGRPEDFVGRDISSILDLEQSMARLRLVARVAATRKAESYDEHRDGRYYRIKLFPILDTDSQVRRLASYSRDITERRKAEERLTHQAFHDQLTDLPNRAMFLDRLKRLFETTHGAKTSSVLFLDLDNFKLINDSFGHVVGDELLKLFAARLPAILDEDDLLARFGGDEFALLLKTNGDLFQALRIADKVHDILRSPFVVGGLSITVTASLGVVLKLDGYSQADLVLRDADIAMYKAKDRSRSSTEFFDNDMHLAVLRRADLESELRRAVEQKEFTVHYQPMYHCSDVSLAGFEALVRWVHPQRGMISPAEFIPVAEETGLILDIGDLVLDEACGRMSEWIRSSPAAADLVMHVNFSGCQFLQADPVQAVRSALERHGLTPCTLGIEITESMLLEDAERCAAMLGALRAMGVRVSLDDFGTGYSSLSYLRNLPLDAIKMDKSFIQGLAKGSTEEQIARSVVQLAHALGLSVTAEGVEDVQAVDLLDELDCNLLQGFHLARPMEANQIRVLLDSASPRIVQPSSGQVLADVGGS